MPTNAYTLGGKRLSRHAASACFQKCIVANNHRHLLAFWLVLALPSQRVANLRSVHTAASVPSHWGDTALPGLAFGTPGSLICSCISFPLPPACPPWLHGRYPLHRCYEGSDSCPAPAAPGQVSLVHQFVLPDLPSPPTEYRPCGGNALLPPQAWPPLRFGGYRRCFGFRAVPAVSAVVFSRIEFGS